MLHGFAAAQSASLIEEIKGIEQAAAFRHLVTPGGYSMSVAMTNCGPLGWVYEFFDQIQRSHDGVSRLRRRPSQEEKKLLEELLPIERYVQI